jgi:mono/diheme cytochrome c family protein
VSILPRQVPLVLVGFVLGACKTGSAPASAPAGTATASVASGRPISTAGAGITPQLIARGDTIFHASSCTDCHGRRAKGSPHGPDLTSGNFAQTDGSYQAIVKIITTGVPVDSIVDPAFPEPMPARGGTPPLSDEQIRSLAAYVYSLSHR